MPEINFIHKTIRSKMDVDRMTAVLGDLGLPLEIAISILSLADYRLTIASQTVLKHPIICSTNSKQRVMLCLLSPPVPATTTISSPVQWVRFRTVSNDQGWASTIDSACGPYHSSWSWFEVSILRKHSCQDLIPVGQLDSLDERAVRFSDLDVANKHFAKRGFEMVSRSLGGDVSVWTWHVQNNRCAENEKKEHIVSWEVGVEEDEAELRFNKRGNGEGFLETLQVGDVVALWAVAQVR